MFVDVVESRMFYNVRFFVNFKYCFLKCFFKMLECDLILIWDVIILMMFILFMIYYFVVLMNLFIKRVIKIFICYNILNDL